MRKIYTERLLFFADHLSRVQNHEEFQLTSIVHFLSVGKDSVLHEQVTYRPWVFDELIVFEEWFFEEQTGEPKVIGWDPGLSTIESVIDFLGLLKDDFIFLFDISADGFSYENVGLTGEYYAEKIIQLVRKWRQENE